jgi:hypothetical protein
VSDSVFSKLRPEDMPCHTSQCIARTCGVGKAIQFLRFFGAQRLYMPKLSRAELRTITQKELPNDDMSLVAEKCGVEVAVALMKHFPRQRQFIPVLDKDTKSRYVQICHDGGNTKRLALELGVAEMSVYRYLKRAN